MEFFRRAGGRPARLGVFPGTFNPVTVAHLALARAALAHVDEVVFVLPRVFPHKDYSGASFEDRLAMLQAAATDPAFSIAAASGGLFIDIVRECRAAYGDGVRPVCLCGRDAAERIANWDYGRPGAFAEMLAEFDLLVVDRGGAYHPPAEYASSVRCIDVDGAGSISATEIRERARRGEAWEHLAPESIRTIARRVYTQEEGSLANPRPSKTCPDTNFNVRSTDS
jgi:nicotinate-nucleotide adenylyltransferase